MTSPAPGPAPAPASSSASARAGSPALRRMAGLGRRLGPLWALAVVIGLFGAADRWKSGPGATFLSARNARAVASQMATVAVASLGMTLVIIAGGIDLSAGTALALCATVLAWSLKEDVLVRIVHGQNASQAAAELRDAEIRRALLAARLSGAQADEAPAELREEQSLLESRLPQLRARVERLEAASRNWRRVTPLVAIGLAVLTGCACGLLNGLLVSVLRVVPFIVTLGTMSLYLGLAKIVAKETTIRPDRLTQVPAWLDTLLSIREDALVGGFPVGVWFALVLAAATAAVLRYTVFSRHVFALGSNESTARLCGVGIRRTKLAVYTLAGMFFGIAGVYQFSRLSVGSPTSGIGLELKVIAAVVIGGASLNGGRGSILGTLMGAAVMAVIDDGCTLLGLTNPVQDVILGVIIVAAVAADRLRQARLAA